MSAAQQDEPDRLEGFPHPREASALFGHQGAQAAMLDGLKGGRLHHAWLIGGPEGIGKATFAYRMAKHLLGVHCGAAGADGMPFVDEAAPASRLVAQLAHPDLVVLRRQLQPRTGTISTQITVDHARRALDMFASTAGQGGWRVCIVDSADDLNSSSGNALLKVIEEPPPRAIFLIVAHQPGRVLPTIRSRCRKLMLRPLAEGEVLDALRLIEPSADAAAMKQAASLSDGAVRRALLRLDPDTAALILATRAELDKLPRFALDGVMKIANQIAGKRGEAESAIFMETLEDWVSQHMHGNIAAGAHRLAPLAEVWEKTSRSVRETEAFNLDRRALVLSIFHDLADAVSRLRAA
jgi:DNA polymerase-3 subunit delta'